MKNFFNIEVVKMFDYYEAARNCRLTRRQALSFIREHGVVHTFSNGNGDSIEEFTEDCGNLEYYDAQKVVTWLGM